jgi:hypothetical protein
MLPEKAREELDIVEMRKVVSGEEQGNSSGMVE